jgi:glycosyltransferase involved in cell wall biosynthesis
VADQGGAGVEHLLVLKALSPTPSFPAGDCRILSQVPASGGLYGALNQGLAAAQGNVLAWLNDDEQYLPGTLDFVRQYFDAHPAVDLVFGDFLVVDAEGHLLAFRKGYAPRWPYILSAHLYLFSCTLFFRRRVWESGLRFDTTFQSAGDMDFVARALRAGFRAVHVPRYFSAFTWTGENLSSSAAALPEERRVHSAAPLWVRGLRWPLNLARLAEKYFSGAYRQAWPLTYALYQNDLTRRTTLAANSGSWRWPQRCFK